MFIYKALAEWYMFGETDVDVSQFRDRYRSLLEPQEQPSASTSNISIIAAAIKRSTPKLSRAMGENSSVEKVPTCMEVEYKVTSHCLQQVMTNK